MKKEGKYIFGESIMEIIRKRKSIRTYARSPISTEIKDEIQRYFHQIKGPFQADIRFALLDKLAMKVDEKVKLGTYGVIQGASLFIAAAVKKREHSMEQLGYVFEHLILYLTSLGLGTCWLAGTFNKSEFAKAMRIEHDEILPIVTPVGHAGSIRSPIDILIKPFPAMKTRKAWDKLFYQNGFRTKLDEIGAGAYALPLEMVRLAPSASNRQPWRVVEKDGDFDFYLAHDAVYKHKYPYDIQRIDMGIAMCHFESTVNELGLKGRWEIRDPALDNLPKDLEYIITWVTE